MFMYIDGQYETFQVHLFLLHEQNVNGLKTKHFIIKQLGALIYI